MPNLTPWQRALYGHVLLTANRAGYLSVQMLYAQAEEHLQAMYPCNKSIRANIRDELQNLGKKGLLRLRDRGVWQVLPWMTMPCCSETGCRRQANTAPRRAA
jgi:hypothetical protein